MNIIEVNNLLWTPVLGKMSWVEARDYVKDLSYGGYKDWRLPTINELEKVLRKKKFHTDIYMVWSSESRGEDCCTKAPGWFANFRNKNVSAYPKDSKFGVRAVRNI